MNYEVTQDEAGNEHIVIRFDENRYKGFPADNSNPEFIAFLRELEKENDPYFQAWVEAGNDPDEFWTQREDI
jgi:hypothetical protein